MYPKDGGEPVSPSPRFPDVEREVLALLGRGRHLPGVDRPARGRARVGVLRRAAVRERPPALRPPADRVREGRLPALPDDARQAGAPALRLGHARPARRARGDAPARHHHQGRDRVDGRRHLQRRGARIRPPLHRGVARLRDAAGALGRLRQRLQDARPELHGERALGLQAAARPGPRLRGRAGAALLLERRDAAVEPRAADGRRRLQASPGPLRHRHLPAGGGEGRGARPHRGAGARLDDHPLDAADERGARRRARHRVRGRAERPRRHHGLGGARQHRGDAGRIEHRGVRGVPDRDRPRRRLRQGARLRVRRRGAGRRLPHRARPRPRRRAVRPALGLLRR